MNNLEKYIKSIFENIKHIDENGNEYWEARELMPLLEYTLWQRFSNAIKKAMENCKNSNNTVLDHFISADKMGIVELGANVFRITQTEALLERQKLPNEDKATNTHYKVGKAIRDTIKKIGGNMPEELPTPKKSIKELEKEKNEKLVYNK